MKVPSNSLAADILVIGAGPVGLFLANLLGRAGMTTLLMERWSNDAHLFFTPNDSLESFPLSREQRPSAVRAWIIRHALLRFPLSRRLPRYFAMLTIPNGLARFPDRRQLAMMFRSHGFEVQSSELFFCGIVQRITLRKSDPAPPTPTNPGPS